MAAYTQPKLPTLTNTPIQHPDSCASLSSNLIKTIGSHIPTATATITSIGCGSGLLESLLLSRYVALRVVGVEVSTCNVKYLDPECVYKVASTRSLCRLAAQAHVWLFVYPRTTELVRCYLEAFRSGKVKVIVWIGPTRDWCDFRPIFEKAGLGEGEMSEVAGGNAGLAEYESMVVVRNKSQSVSVGDGKVVSHAVAGIDDI